MGLRDSAFAIIRRAARVLIVKSRTKSRWQLPGGHIKAGEAPWDAALREVSEETGLDARIGTLTGMYHRTDGSFAYVFQVHVARGMNPKGPRNEIIKQRWVTVEKAVEKLTRSAATRLLDAVRRPRIIHLTG